MKFNLLAIFLLILGMVGLGVLMFWVGTNLTVHKPYYTISAQGGLYNVKEYRINETGNCILFDNRTVCGNYTVVEHSDK